MQSYELLREVFEKKTPKQVAADLGLSLSMVYKWAEPPNDARLRRAAAPAIRSTASKPCSPAPAIIGSSSGFASARAVFSSSTRRMRRIRIT